MGAQDATIVTWRSVEEGLSTFAVAGLLAKKGWQVDRQHRPDSVHCTVMSHHLDVVDDYVRDLAAAVDEARADPSLGSSGEAAMYGMMAKIPARGMVKDAVRKVMEQMYAPGAGGGPVKVEANQDGGLVDRMLARYGPQALGALDRLAAVRAKVGLKPRGRR
jgi:hypothetical protein